MSLDRTPRRRAPSVRFRRQSGFGGDGRWLSRAATPDASQSRFEIGNEFRKGPISRAGPGNQHIIGSRSSKSGQDAHRRLPHPPLRAVADDGIADFSARGEPDPYPGGAPWFVRTRCGLHNQPGPGRSAPGARHSKEFGADLQRFEFAAHKVSC